MTPIPERAGVDAEVFNKEILPSGRPVVMRGLVGDWPVVQAGLQSAEALGAYLKRFDGGVPVRRMTGAPEIEGKFFYVGELDGLEALLAEAWQRYGRPLAVTEAHLSCTREEQMRWLLEVWRAAGRLRDQGADVRAVTAWALLGAYDWDSLVTVPRGHHAPRTAHPPHLGQRGDRVGQVLKHLVRVHHVERSVAERQPVDVTGLEPEVGQAPAVGLGLGLGQHAGRRVDPGDLAVRHPGGQVRGDRARAAADVQYVHARLQVPQQVAGRVLGGPPPVRAEDGVVVAVQVSLG